MQNKIKLLDGNLYDKEQVISNMYSDDYYYGFLRDNALSSSSLSLLKDGIKTYYYVMKYGQTETAALSEGRLFHTMILEPQKLDQYVFLDVESKNTKAYKEAKSEYREVYTAKEKRDAERLVDALLKNPTAISLLTDRDYEVPIIGNIKDTPFRGKADIISSKGIVDLKTSISVKDFEMSARKYGYHRQAYIYCTLFDVPYNAFTFLVIDKKNLDIGIFNISEETFLQGKYEVELLIDLYWQTIANDDFDINEYVTTGTL